MDRSTQTVSPASRLSVLRPDAVQGAGIVLCDLDGCLISQGSAFAEAAAFVAACGPRLWIVSNRSDMTAEGLAAHLRELDLPVPSARILLAGEVALLHLIGTGMRRLRLYAAPALMDLARALGVDPESTDPEAVLLCRDPGLTVDGLGELLSLVQDGAPLWVANQDLSHPGHDGRPVAETGALLAALKSIRPELTSASLAKPNPTMLELALDRAGRDAAEAVFVGDNADTDGRAAAAIGIPFLHVQRGAHR